MTKTTFTIQSCLHGFPYKILKILKFLNCCYNYLSLTNVRAQIACCELKGDLSPVMLKEIFHDSFENFEITRICMENYASVTQTNASNFRRPLQSLLLRYTAENSQVT